MGLTIKNEGKDKELCPEGTYPVTCVSITDLGTQSHEVYGDKRKFNVGFEIANETDSEGNPFIVYRTFNAGLTMKSHLGKTLKSWLGMTFEKDEEFDLDELLGKQGQATIIHNEGTDGNVYANVDTLTSLMKGIKVPKTKTALSSFYLDENFDQETFDDLPEFIREKIAKSPEYQAVLEAKQSAKRAKKAAPAPAKKKGR